MNLKIKSFEREEYEQMQLWAGKACSLLTLSLTDDASP